MLFGEEGGAFAAVVQDHVCHGEGADADADYWGGLVLRGDGRGRDRGVFGGYKGGEVPVNPTNV